MNRIGMFRNLKRFSTDWAVVELKMSSEPVIKLSHENKWASILGFNGKITETGDIIGNIIRFKAKLC